jgi:hypothetical protein
MTEQSGMRGLGVGFLYLAFLFWCAWMGTTPTADRILRWLFANLRYSYVVSALALTGAVLLAVSFWRDRDKRGARS